MRPHRGRDADAADQGDPRRRVAQDAGHAVRGVAPVESTDPKTEPKAKAPTTPSTVESPVKVVHQLCDGMKGAARKNIMAACPRARHQPPHGQHADPEVAEGAAGREVERTAGATSTAWGASLGPLVSVPPAS